MNINILLFLLCVFFIFIIINGLYSNSVESFSLGSLTQSSPSTTDSSSDNQYANLAPLPENNTWSQDTQDAFIKKFNDLILAQDPSANPITSTTINNKNYMQVASEDEAKSFVENGVWPWDIYIKNELDKFSQGKSDEEKKNLENFIKGFFGRSMPNRDMYKIIANTNVPQSMVMNALNPSLGNGLVLPAKTNQILTCKQANKGTVKQTDGTNLIIEENGLYPYTLNSKNSAVGNYTLDYTIFESIPGLVFDSSACNICQIKDFAYFGNPFMPEKDVNKCKFSIKTPEAYNIYTGINKT
jgi:hypothetical protein